MKAIKNTTKVIALLVGDERPPRTKFEEDVDVMATILNLMINTEQKGLRDLNSADRIDSIMDTIYEGMIEVPMMMNTIKALFIAWPEDYEYIYKLIEEKHQSPYPPNLKPDLEAKRNFLHGSLLAMMEAAVFLEEQQGLTPQMKQHFAIFVAELLVGDWVNEKYAEMDQALSGKLANISSKFLLAVDRGEFFHTIASYPEDMWKQDRPLFKQVATRLSLANWGILSLRTQVLKHAKDKEEKPSKE